MLGHSFREVWKRRKLPPKNQVSVDSGQVSVTRSREGEGVRMDLRFEISDFWTCWGILSGKCGKSESCHPKNQVTVDRDQVSVTRSRGGWGWGKLPVRVFPGFCRRARRSITSTASLSTSTKGECGERGNCHPQSGSWGRERFVVPVLDGKGEDRSKAELRTKSRRNERDAPAGPFLSAVPPQRDASTPSM